ncbi:UNVERIFIED_ORG: ferredoxin [Pseudomonas reinekei]|nr:ferredoxin [Pseudomonas reinekei]
MLNTLLPILLFAALGLGVLGALRRVAMWRRGRASKVDLIGGLFAMPKRYMVDLHHVVARDKYIANTHVATAGGAVASIVLAILVHGFGLHNRFLGYALLLMSAVMFVGAIFVYLRRRNPPARLSKGPWMRLPKSLLAFSASFFLVTLPVAGILPENFGGWLLAAILGVGVLWGVSELFLGMTWGGPMKHAFAGALHLAWHRRAERFGGGRSTGLKPLDLSDLSAPLGVEKPKDFTWNQLLGFDACVQCGKCEAACPAFAAGQPLNPKKLIQDMVIWPGRWHRCKIRWQPISRQSDWRARRQSASTDRQRPGGRRDPVVVHDLPRLRRGVPDDDRARRCHRRHAPSPDPGKRRDPEQGRRSPGKPDRHRQPGRLCAGRADELGGRLEPQPAQRKEIHRRAVLGR